MKKLITLLTIAFFTTRLFTLSPTPAQPEGPYYPLSVIDPNKKITDGNLVEISTPNSGIASGEVMELTGKVLDRNGKPLANAVIEIWQTDSRGYYNHRSAPNHQKFDKKFQGFGATTTSNDGNYQFLTILPEEYPGRPPHIHVKVKVGGKEKLTTQLYFKNHPTKKAWRISQFFNRGEELKVFLRPASVTLSESGKSVKGKTAEFDLIIQ